MRLDSIQISKFRNLNDVDISPSSGLNLIYGRNGSGKSSLLEAIHFLGYGRSFRTNKANNLVQEKQDKFTIFAKCSTVSTDADHKPVGIQKRLGISRSIRDEFLCSIDGQRSRRVSDMVSLVPVQVFTPQSIEELIGSPSARRRFIDWGLFHVEHTSYVDLVRSYKRVIKQRNALLRRVQFLRKTVTSHSASPSSEVTEDLAFWDSQCVQLGEKIDEQRRQYIAALTAEFLTLICQFLPEIKVKLTYHRGWENARCLKEALVQKHALDIKAGLTSVGPHKADLKLKMDDNRLAIDVLSRGQIRMLVAALHVAQTNVLNQKSSDKGVFLLDDIGAELDANHRSIFIGELLKTQTQLFITAIDKNQFSLPETVQNKKMFHVEHGHVIEE